MSYPGLSKLSDITRAFRGHLGVGLPFELKVLEICLDMVSTRRARNSSMAATYGQALVLNNMPTSVQHS
jgi:hypothetical protein